MRRLTIGGQDLQRSGNDIDLLYRYHPKYRWYVPNHQHFYSGESELILQLMRLNENAINLLTGRLVDHLNKSPRYMGIDAICSIPAGYHESSYSGVRIAAMKIAQELNYIDGTACLVRAKNKSVYIFRSKSLIENYETFAVQHRAHISNKRVLLLDGLTSSGNTLEAGAQKLMEAGAREVVKFALGGRPAYGC